MSAEPTLEPTLAHSVRIGTPDAEAAFYCQYDWCLNPLRTVRELIGLVIEETGRLRRVQLSWQREECQTNIYLFACAVSMTVADCIAPQFADMRRLARRFGGWGSLTQHAHNSLQLAHRVRNRVFDRHVAAWLHEWNKCVELSCSLLFTAPHSAVDLANLDATVSRLSSKELPQDVLDARMQLPFAFREQDFTPHDVLDLADAFTASHASSPEPLVVIGLRTAGGYFAPLLSERLRRSHWKIVNWLSIRPKKGLSAWERRGLQAARAQNVRVLLTDDHPDTGETLRLALNILESHGIPPSKVTILVPSHPAQKYPLALRGGRPDVDLVTTPADRSFKHRQLVPNEVENILREYYWQEGWDTVRVTDTRNRLSQSLRDRSRNFHLRLKRVFDVSLSRPGCEPVGRRVFAKDVGCGWLGYHAYIAGTRLQGFVPRVLGLRHGLLFSEWVDPQQKNGDRPPVSTIASYIGTRARTLALGKDPSSTHWNQGNTFWFTLLTTLRSVYGPYVGRAKATALGQVLKRYAAPVPAFIDANLREHEWTRKSGRWLKLDYEHHAFGNPGLNVVDPAYDLASAIFEMALSREEERALIAQYVQTTGDKRIEERLVFHKIVCGRTAQEDAQYHMRRAQSHVEKLAHHSRYIAASDFLTFELSRFCGQVTRPHGPSSWSDKIFLLDLDGVFDTPLLQFPHTTHAGVRALNWLHANQYSVVINTGRSARHVREYCAAYSLAGGVAEHGAVFINAISGRESSMVSVEEANELKLVRQRIQNESALFLDPTYEHAIRVANFESGNPGGLTQAQAEMLLQGTRTLRFLSTKVDTYILPVRCNKGTGWAALQAALPVKVRLTAAIGDSNPDLDLLRMAQYSYAPANCSPGIRELARKTGCHIMRKPFQSGLLLALRDLARRTGDTREAPNGESLPISEDHLLWLLLSAADRSGTSRLISLANWWRL